MIIFLVIQLTLENKRTMAPSNLIFIRYINPRNRCLQTIFSTRHKFFFFSKLSLTKLFPILHDTTLIPHLPEYAQ